MSELCVTGGAGGGRAASLAAAPPGAVAGPQLGARPDEAAGHAARAGRLPGARTHHRELRGRRQQRQLAGPRLPALHLPDPQTQGENYGFSSRTCLTTAGFCRSHVSRIDLRVPL